MTYKKQKYITVSELAQKCGCSRQYLHHLIKTHKILPTHSIGKGRIHLFGKLRAEKIQKIYFPESIQIASPVL